MPNSIEEQAKYLASENLKADKDISKVYWFPDSQEVRLIELQNAVPANGDEKIFPFYFSADPKRGLRWTTAIALIRPEEFRKLTLPEAWGEWKDAVELETAQ
jgi:hypothetical protein